ncbi:hypothetical protein ABZO31_22860 [Streptomyces sp. HUAS MG47]|uniref:hypothetical protein n=1 Tax=Streptomyces solicamelliae TaxID=3231716 RepID=UPI0038778F95
MTDQRNRTAVPRPNGRRGRWERYRVTHPFSPKDLAGLWGALIGVVALAVLLGWALDMKGGVVIVLAMPFIVSWFENRRTAFQFDAAGVRFGQVLLPWTDITEFVVATPPDESKALIGARLHPGAQVPAGTGTPHHPAMPAPVHIAVQREKFSLQKMVTKARTYAPPHIRIMVADPSGERPAT